MIRDAWEICGLNEELLPAPVKEKTRPLGCEGFALWTCRYSTCVYIHMSIYIYVYIYICIYILYIYTHVCVCACMDGWMDGWIDI